MVSLIKDLSEESDTGLHGDSSQVGTYHMTAMWSQLYGGSRVTQGLVTVIW